MSLTETIKEEASHLGFDAVGIASLSRFYPSAHQVHSSSENLPLHRSSWYSRLKKWLDQGYHATMEWMTRDPERRSDPTLVLPGCRSIVSVGLNYFTGHQPNECDGNGRIARYAWGQDYHLVFTKRLQQLESIILALAPDAKTKWYVDTGPILEKAWAQEAGLGWIGKHSNLVSSEFGSWLVLGEILTTLELTPDTPGTDLCGSCTLCINACPTGAIVDPYVVNAEKCISYLTIEFRGDEEDISDEIKQKIGNRIFGCDDCLDVCPFNHHTPTQEIAFQPSALTIGPNLSKLNTLKPEEFNETFRGSPIRRAKHQGFLRNIRMAQENS